MKSLAPFVSLALALLGASCADPHFGPSAPSEAVGTTETSPSQVNVPTAPVPKQVAPVTPQRTGIPAPKTNSAPPLALPPLPSEENTKLAAVKVAESKLVPYIVYGVMGYNGEPSRFFLQGPERALTTNPSKIWAEAGYWGCEIVQISGRGVASLSSRERFQLLWDGADPVRLVIRTRSGSLKTIDTFTRSAFALPSGGTSK